MPWFTVNTLTSLYPWIHAKQNPGNNVMEPEPFSTLFTEIWTWRPHVPLCRLIGRKYAVYTEYGPACFNASFEAFTGS